jgi:hypothetical protein
MLYLLVRYIRVEKSLHILYFGFNTWHFNEDSYARVFIHYVQFKIMFRMKIKYLKYTYVLCEL